MKHKVSCIMPTYGRFHTVERSISFFCEQDYPDKELIIVDTAPIPLMLSAELAARKDIRLMNIRFDHKTLRYYETTGAIRRDALTNATGDLYIGWDDDDLWAPFHVSQAVENYDRVRQANENIIAWKPRYSLYSPDGGGHYKKVENNMEASIIASLESVYFTETTGPEMISWLKQVRAEGRIIETDDVPVSYCYFWGDGHHKQSGDICNPRNFENHLEHERDFGTRPLQLIDVSEYHKIWK